MVAPLYLVMLVSTASKSIDTWANDLLQAAFSLAILGSAFLFAW